MGLLAGNLSARGRTLNFCNTSNHRCNSERASKLHPTFESSRNVYQAGGSPDQGREGRQPLGESAEREKPGLLGTSLTRHPNLGAAKIG